MLFKTIERRERISYTDDKVRSDIERRLFQRISGCISISEVEICVSIDTEEKKAYVTIKIKGEVIFTATLDENHLCASVPDICLFGVCLNNAEVCVDWNETKVTAKGEICLSIFCKDFDIVVFDW